MAINLNLSWAGWYGRDAGFRSLADTAYENKMTPEELYSYVDKYKDGIKKLKSRGFSFKEIFFNSGGDTLREHLIKLRNGKSASELIAIAQSTPLPSTSTAAVTTTVASVAPSVAVSNFSTASRDLLRLRDEDLEGNITIKELYKKYPDMLNKEFLKGNIELDEYNELLASYKLRKKEEIVPLGENTYNTKPVKIKKNPPKYLSQISR